MSWRAACRLVRGGGGLGAGDWCFGIGRLSGVSSKAWFEIEIAVGALDRDEVMRKRGGMASSNYQVRNIIERVAWLLRRLAW